MPSFNEWKMAEVWKLFILAVYQNISYVLQFLPEYLSLWLCAALRILFFSVITFSAWIKTFPVGNFPVAFSQVVLVLSAGYVCYVQTNQWSTCWPEREKKLRKTFEAERNQVNKWLEEGLEDQTNMTKTFHAVTRTLEEAERKQDLMEENESAHRQEIFTLKEMIKYLRNYNANLERKIEKRREEVLRANAKFQSKIADMEALVGEMQDAEIEKKRIENELQRESSAKEDLNKTNVVLQNSVNVMNKQRKSMLEKQNEMARKIRELQTQNDELRHRLQSYSNHDFGEINKITRKLQTSLSSAKGKLAKVRGVLKEGDSTRHEITSF